MVDNVRNNTKFIGITRLPKRDWNIVNENNYKYMSVGTKVSGLTYKSRAKWKMLRGIYSAIYGKVNVLVSVCVEIKGDYIEK